MTKGRPREFDLNQALDRALVLFWQHGFEGVSISLLASEIGVNAPSLYAAFGNKEQLFLKAVQRYGEFAGKIYSESFKCGTAYEVARAILIGEVNLVTQRDRPNGCLMIQGAISTSPESQAISDQMAKMRSTAEGWIADRFRQAQDSNDLPKEVDADALACYIMTVNSGLAIQARTGVSKRQLLKVVELALASFPGSHPTSRRPATA